MEGDDSSAIQPNSLKNKSGSSHDDRKHVKFEKTHEGSSEGKNIASTLPKINQKRPQSQGKISDLTNARTIKKPNLKNNRNVRASEIHQTDSIVIDDIPTDGRGVQFRNSQSKKKLSIRKTLFIKMM